VAETAAVEYVVLGPLEVRVDGRAVELRGGKQRALLTMLLLNAGKVVSGDSLTDALWGEQPPASAANSIRIYVSQLRKLLGEGRLLTRSTGYLLQVQPDELDANRFERLVGEGRARRTAGDPASAVAALTEALALWHGPSLVDVAYMQFAQADIARLEEIRLSAVEERAEAELELGRAAELTPELEGLVRAHPLRERLRSALMLALYRSGRQADALEVYRQGRRALTDELGLEPGPALSQLEQAILRQDAALDAPSNVREIGRDATHRRRGSLLILAGAALLLLAGIGAAVAELTGRGSGLALMPPNALGIIDPGRLTITAAIPLPGASQGLLAVRGGTAWVDDGRGTLSEIDPSGVARVIPIDAAVSDVATGPGAVWAVSRRTGRLTKIDASYGTVVRRATIRGGSSFLAGLSITDPWSVADGAGAVWVTDGSTRLVRVDRESGNIARRINLRTPLSTVAVSQGAVWAASSRAATVIRLDPRSGSVTARIQLVSRPGLKSPWPVSLAVGAGFVWVLSANTATVTKIDPGLRGVVATIPIGVDRDPRALAAGEGAAWVGDGDGTVLRIDAATNAVRTIRLGREVQNIGVSEGRVWVSVGAAATFARGGSNAPHGHVQALAASFCSPIYYGGTGVPQYLIGSDLPMQGPVHSLTRQMVEAITFVLERHHFRAGRYRVGYQACDAATSQTALEAPAKCAANARAYARDRSVLGVIGSWSSECSRFEIPIANQASGGPLGMISPSNTYVGLTRRNTETAAGEPDKYYPTGRRNYVRVIAADDFQAAADAVAAHRLGVRSVYVLYVPIRYGIGLGAEFARAARRLRIRVVGSEHWDPSAGNYRTLTSRIKRSGANGVFLAGALFANGVTLLKDLRAGLGPDVEIMASDGFAPPSDDINLAGNAAEGLTISVAGVPNERLGPVGRQFVRSFGTVSPRPYYLAAYAAQAADVLLEAIARSDGTRGSVVRKLLRTRVTNGILGSFTIGRSGDTSASAVTIYRIVRGRTTTLTVITPPESLIKP
jgi:DNA-binding SARP family transcriptional activator/ABC-type branched-subunit amino acid transport system substrate-binding protein/streptogramin lyase